MPSHCLNHETHSAAAGPLFALLLESASAGPSERLASGCQTLVSHSLSSPALHRVGPIRRSTKSARSSPYTPPPSRLVGIELNPGPPKFGANVAAAIGSMLASTVKKSKTKKKKPTPPKKNPVTSRPPAAPRSRGYVATMYSTMQRPVLPFEQSVTVPFRTSILGVYTQGAAGSAVNIRQCGTLLAGSSAVDLNPFKNGVPGQAAMFGLALQQLSNSFDRWKMNSLEVQYNPAIGSTTAGTLAMGYSQDPYVTGSGVSYPAVTSTQDSVSFAPWEPVQNRITQLNRNVLFVNENNNATEPQQRICQAGTITMSGVGLPFVDSTLLGTLTFVGSLTFYGLSYTNAGVISPASDASSSSPSSSSSSLAPPILSMMEPNGDYVAVTRSLLSRLEEKANA